MSSSFDQRRAKPRKHWESDRERILLWVIELMARRPPLFIPDLSVHVYPRGINRGAIARDDTDHEHVLRAIIRAARRYGLEINAFALMTTHYPLVVTPTCEGALARSMKAIVMERGVLEFGGGS